ncbi:hypothetical protein Tco_1105020, partial [Tanacetum coccineum]
LTSSELKTVVTEYNIPLDLHLRLPPPGMTLNRLPSRHFGGHWFSFENKTGRGTKKCFKEVTSRLKWWKRKIFLLDRCAIPDAMPWKHGDTDLHDDFSASYNKNDAARLSEFLVHLRPPPRHFNDTFLKLPTWTRTVVSKGDPILEDQCPKPRVTPSLAVGVEIPELIPFQKNLEKPNSKIVVAREKKDQQNLAKAEAKRDGAGNAEGPRKKRKVQKHNEPTQSGSKEAFSATPLHQAAPEVSKRPVTIAEVAKDTPIPRRKFLTLVVTRT